MCGIYGLLSKSYAEFGDYDFGIIDQMATLTELRGKHSSGQFAVVNGKTIINKTLGPSCNLAREKFADKFEKLAKDSKVLIGHGRWATIGKITKANAHPFKEDHITLVHNGTIRHGLDVADAQVDSHALAVAIAKKGLKEAVSDILGAWAIICHDAKKNLVHIFRNSERDLHYLETPFGIYIMSEKDALVYLAARNTLKGDIKPFEANVLYTYDPEKMTLSEDGKITGSWGVTHFGFPKPVGRTWTQVTPLGGNSGGSNSSAKVTYRNIPVVADPQVSTPVAKLDYDVGDLIYFAVKDYIILNGNYHFRGVDERGNEVKFHTSNKTAAAAVKDGMWGIAEIFAVGMNYKAGKAAYMVRFREIEWDKPKDQPTVLVATYGGDIVAEDKWKELCATGCFACQGPIAEDDNTETVVTAWGNGLRAFCKHCVDTHMEMQGATVEGMKNYHD